MPDLVVPVAGQPLLVLPPPPGCPCCTGARITSRWSAGGLEPWQLLCDPCLWFAVRISACPHVLAREAA